MPALDLVTLDGTGTAISEDSVQALSGSLRGELLTGDSPGYEEARAVWNAMIDRRPALIVR